MRFFFKLDSLFYCLGLLLANSISLTAQQTFTFTGKVVNQSLQEEIVGASIYQLEHPTTAVITDTQGRFEFLLAPGNYRFVCSYIGMKNDTFSFLLDKNLQRDFVLGVKERQLQTFVISAGRYEQRLEEITVSMEVLKPKLIEQRNTTNIKSTLEQAPGLTILDGEPQIRGGSGFSFGVGSRVATLIDGIPIMAGDAGRTEWNFIPVENVEQIEIIKGASSVCYGSSALSGTINIRSAYPKEQPETKIRLYSGFYSAPKNDSAKWWNGLNNFSGFTFLHAQKFGKFDLVLGGMGSYDHGYIGPPVPHLYLPIKADTIGNSDVAERNGRINFNLRFRPSKIQGLSLGINGNFMLSHSNFSLVWNDDTSGIYRAFPGTMTISDRSIFYVDPFISYLGKAGFRHDIKTRLFYTNNQNGNNQSNESTVTYYEYQLHKSFAALQNLKFTGGLVFNKTYSHAKLYAASGSPNNSFKNFSAYSQLDKTIFKILNLSLGFRAEYFRVNAEESVMQPIFRGGLNLKLTPGTFLRGSYGQGFRFPTITEKFILTSAGGITIFPNDSLLPESSSNLEIGIKQGFKIGNFAGFADIAVFQQAYQNTIEYIYAKWSPDSAGFKFVNTGDTRVKGIEVSIGADGMLNKNWGLSFIGGYSYVVPEAMDTGYVFARDRPADGFIQSQLNFANTSTDTTASILKYRFQHIAKCDAEFSYKFVSLGGSWRYYSFMKNIDKTFYDLDEPYLLPTGIKRYRKEHDKGIHVFDARLSFQVQKFLRLSLVVNNLANLEYSLRPLKIEAPRTIALQLSLKF